MAETITFSYTESGEDITVTLNENARGPAGPAPSGTGFVKVTAGVLDTPSASIAQSDITDLTSDLALKAPLASPTFTGTVTADTHQATTTAGIVVKNSAGATLLTIGKLDAGTGFLTGFAEGSGTTASGNRSHAEGYATIASGSDSHAEGGGSEASGIASHAEGSNATASGNYSHAEGSNATASGASSHAEGRNTTASGNYSHVEGSYSVAAADYSHAAGRKARVNDAAHTGSRVITDGQDAYCDSTAADQLTYRFQNGYRFLGGAADFAATPTVSGTALALETEVAEKIADYAISDANQGQIHELATNGTIVIDLPASVGAGTTLTLTVVGSGKATLSPSGGASLTGAATLFGGGYHTLYKSTATEWIAVSPLSGFSAATLAYGAASGVTDAIRLGKADNLIRWAATETEAAAQNGAEWATLATSASPAAVFLLGLGNNKASGTVLDLVDPTKAATLTGNVARAGRAMSFPGSTNDYLELTSTAAVNPTSFTVAIWVKASDVSATKYLVGKMSTSNYQWYLRTNAGKLEAYVSADGTASNYFTRKATSVSITANTWVFLAATFTEGSPDGVINLFVNGAAVAMDAAALTGNVPSPFAGTATIKIGTQQSSTTTGSLLVGTAAYFGHFSRALTAAELSDLMILTRPTQ